MSSRIRAAFLSRRLRRWVAVVAGALVVACQGLALADIRLPGSAHPGAAPAVAPCHQGMPDGGADPHEGRCQTKYPSYNTSPPQLPDATPLPAFAVGIELFRVEARAMPAADPRRARIEAPPLTILHCCLRN